ncbi:sensor histidine kinase [Erythrobacter sp.]|uniref:sensor histidine kinase n=1 Tax=Erythrobacter sp. TaxID=1042 RepID=UPI0025EFA580|nr:sensor histidine kinase [Erythrobacter sp.]
MTELDRSVAKGRMLRWEAIDHPAIWLAYLPLFFIPWLIKLPSPAQMIGAGAGLAVFLAVYFVSLRAAGARLVVLAVAALLLAFALAFTGSNWTVIAVYAAAMIAELRPARRASLGVGAFAAASAALALLTGQPAIYWVLGVFLMVMVGIGNISRAALQDKNRELAAAQGEVRQFAAAAERERIGRDLHDLLGRTLTLIALKADLAARLADSAPDKATAEMRDIAAAAREGLAEVRAAVSGMTGASLAREIAGSKAALAAAGIACEVEGDAEAIDPGTSAVLAMALREAVTNVIRHSGARTCRIALIQQPGGLELKVSDDGDGQAVRAGGGLAGLTLRLNAAGGELAVAGDRRGTRLTARLPQGAAA